MAFSDVFSNFAASIFSIDTSWFTISEKNSAYLLWQNMQGATNVIIAFVLLVIIFSQLTGYGIDNYGAKKMFPKLVVTVILAQLSFVICAIAVDVSNILGQGLLDWMNDVQAKVELEGTTLTPGTLFAGVLDLIFVEGAAAISIISTLGASLSTLSGPVIIIGMLLALLTAVVAVLFVFLMLAAREIMCMALVAISPLALICMLFPNTQKLFKKWLDMLKSLLMVYPMIAAMYGGAKIIRTVILSNANNSEGVVGFMMLMIGLALPFVPFFLIPSILKKALGAVGGMIDKLQNKTNGAIRSGQRAFMGSRFAQASNNKAIEKRQKGLEEKTNKNASKTPKSRFGKSLQDIRNEMMLLKSGRNEGMLKDYQNKINAGAAAANRTATGIETDELELDENGNPIKKKYFKNADGKWIDSAGEIQNEDMANKLNDMLEGKFSAPDKLTSGGKEWKRNKNGQWFDSDGNMADKKTTGDLEAQREAAKQEAMGHRVIQNEDLAAKVSDVLTRQFGTEGITARDGNNYKLQQDGSWIDESGNVATGDILADLQAKQNAKISSALGAQYEFKEIETKDKNGNVSKERKWVRKNTNGSEDVIEGEELESVEQLAQSNKLKAIGGRAIRYHSDGSGGLVDMAGNKLDATTARSLFNAGAYQTGSDLNRIQGQVDYMKTIGGMSAIAGQDVAKLANASGMVAETGSASQINQTIGQSNAIKDVRNIGGTAEMTQLAAGQSAFKQYASTASGNVSAAVTWQTNIDAREKAVNEAVKKFEDHAKSKLTMEQKVEIVRNAKEGTLDKLAADTTKSDLMRSVAQTLVSDYGGAKQMVDSGTTELRERIDNSLVNLVQNQSTIDTQQKYQIMRAAQKGTLEQDIINNTSSTPEMVNIAQRMIEKSGDFNNYVGLTSSEYKNIIDSTAMGQNVATKIGNNIPAPASMEGLNAQIGRIDKEFAMGTVGLLDKQEVNAAATGSVKMQNQFKQETIGNTVGEVELDTNVIMRQAKNDYNLKAAKNNIEITPEITAEYATTLEKQRFDMSQEKMYDEGFKLQTRGDMMTILNNLETNPQFKNDVNYRRSLIKNIQMKGGEDEIIQYAIDNGRNNNKEIQRVYDEFFAASQEPTIKMYGKVINECKEQGVEPPTAKAWFEGTADLPDTITKAHSMQAYFSEQGERALESADKSFVKVIAKNDEMLDKVTDAQLAYGFSGTRNSETKTEFRKIIEKFDTDRRLKIITEVPAGRRASMTESDWSSVLGESLDDVINSNASNLTQNQVDTLIKYQAEFNGLGAHARDNMPTKVKQMFTIFQNMLTQRRNQTSNSGNNNGDVNDINSQTDPDDGDDVDTMQHSDRE